MMRDDGFACHPSPARRDRFVGTLLVIIRGVRNTSEGVAPRVLENRVLILITISARPMCHSANPAPRLEMAHLVSCCFNMRTILSESPTDAGCETGAKTIFVP
jgi:hypothetical protein